MTKRLIMFLFASTLLLQVQAQKFKYVYNGVEFKCKMEDGGATITAFDVKIPQVTIPGKVSYNGMTYPVKEVSTFLNGVNYLTIHLTLEEGIESIDKFAFNEFRKLQTVSLPSTIRHIGKNAFRNNGMLKFNMLSSIDEQALRNGVEVWPTGDGTMIASATQTNIQQNLQYNNQEAELQKALEEQQRQLAEIKKEQERLLAENRKEEKRLQEAEEKREREEKKAKEAASGSGESLSIGKAFASLIGGKNSKKQKNDVPTVAVPENDIAAKPAEPVLPPADVDMDIPVNSSTNNENTYCVIIANEKYEDVPVVDYAARDGEIFKEYCIKTLGIPEKQVKTFINASYTDIKRALSWIETMANISEGNSKMIFYYAGHGIPNEKDKTAYLIPTDGFPKDVTTCFKLSELYSRLSKLKTKNVTVLLDACFSGVERGSTQALVAARGVAIKPKNEVLGGNLVVFSATSNDETALAYQAKRHGMFTYFLLDQLKQTKGNATFGEMFTKITQDVKKNSMLENDKLQTPCVNVSPSMKAKWKTLRF